MHCSTTMVANDDVGGGDESDNDDGVVADANGNDDVDAKRTV